jgi:hypothetical protein
VHVPPVKAKRLSGRHGYRSSVIVRICDAILAFNVLSREGHSEPNCHFAFVNVPRSEEHSEK